MARTKIRTDGFNVSTIVKSILDATTAFGIQTILSLVPGVNVQPYDVDTLTATNTKTVTNKKVVPRTFNILFSSPSTETVPYPTYQGVRYSLQANITFSPSATVRDFDNFFIGLVPDATPRTITWNAGFDSWGATLPTVTTPNKRMIIELMFFSNAFHCLNVYNEP